MKTCKRLGLSSNQLTSVASGISLLEGLETLDLYNNKIQALPVEIANLKSLKRIFVRDSGLSVSFLRRIVPGVELVESTPPELYLQLK